LFEYKFVVRRKGEREGEGEGEVAIHISYIYYSRLTRLSVCLPIGLLACLLIGDDMA
jgi:hypothetical protein